MDVIESEEAVEDASINMMVLLRMNSMGVV